MILKIVEIPHALNSTHIGYNAQLSFIKGVETIQEIPKLEIQRKLLVNRSQHADVATFLIW